MNLSGRLDFIDLSTTERIVSIADASWEGDSRAEYMASIIAEVSTMFGQTLGLHTLSEERTEVYEMGRFKKHLSLDAKPIASVASLKVERLPLHFEDGSALTEDTDFVVNKAEGTVRIFGPQPYNPGYVQITYTGGFFATTSELGSKHQWLTSAAEQQILHRMQRADSLGGNVASIAGQGTTFEGKYDLLPTVRSVLMAHRRAAI